VDLDGERKGLKYHPFSRYKYTMYHCPMRFCNGGHYNAYYEQVGLTGMRPDQNYGEFVPSKGGVVPQLLTPDQLRLYASPYREFVIRDMYAKANSPRFDSAVFLFELEESLSELKRIFTSSLKSILKAKKVADPLSRKLLNTNAEELWLWWRYFLMPAMMDAEAIIEALEGPKIKDRVQDGDLWTDTIKGEYSHGNWFNKWPGEYSWKGDIRVGCGGAMDILFLNDPSKWGTSSWDVVRASWERIPFSFVADWFVNFGDWLASLRDANVVFAQSYATYAIDVKYEVSLNNWEAMDEYPSTIHAVLIDRIVDVEPPKLPLIDRRWRNIYRTIDVIAFATMMLRSIITKRR
jgi:hypothetical protein